MHLRANSFYPCNYRRGNKSYYDTHDQEKVRGIVKHWSTRRDFGQRLWTPFAFYDNKLHGGVSNAAIPQVIQAYMENFDVRRVLVETGTSYNNMYTSNFETIQLTETNLIPYVGYELYGFNISFTKS